MTKDHRLFIAAFILLYLQQGSFSHQTSFQRKSPQCTLTEFQNCMILLQTIAGGNDTALPASKEELTTVCRDLIKGVKCLDIHMRTCFTPEMSSVYKDLIGGARVFINELCDDNQIQTEFLKYAQCYRNISLDEKRCASKYNNAVSAPSSSGKVVDTDLVMKRSCCALREFVHCKLFYVGHDCGENAEVFMEKHLFKITSPITDRHCSAYTFGSEACRSLNLNSGSSAKSTPFDKFPSAIFNTFIYVFLYDICLVLSLTVLQF